MVKLDSRAILGAMCIASVVVWIVDLLFTTELANSTKTSVGLLTIAIGIPVLTKLFKDKDHRELITSYRKNLNNLSELQKAKGKSPDYKLEELGDAIQMLKMAERRLLENGVPMAEWKEEDKTC